MTISVDYQILSGRHVRLEPITEFHVDGLFAIGQQKEDWAYLPIAGFAQEADCEKWVQQALALAASGQHYTYVLIDPVSERVMGSSRYLNVRPRDHGLEIGYTWLGREYQRTAVNTEAKYLLLKNAFDAIGTYRVELKTDLRNLRSQRAIERLGAQKEGVLRRHMITQGGFVRDSVSYSIIDLDWPRVRASLQSMLQDKDTLQPTD